MRMILYEDGELFNVPPKWLADHDKQIRDEVIEECIKEILAEFCENNEKLVPVKVVRRLKQMKGEQNEWRNEYARS